MRSVLFFTAILLVPGCIKSLANGKPSDIRHLYTQVVLLHEDKQEIVMHGVAGQEITITIKTKELSYNGDTGTELWIKVKSLYNGGKVKSKQHRLMFGANGYQEHISLRHKDKKTRQEQMFQLNIDIKILKPGSQPDLNA